ncbi:PP2C family protein-serine/threonine phosphatase [Streptomyces sp. MJP52]|uniref:PP2C family protein-serine/threonine phosphatase n=2 Tax=Streptomyces TaxID=1883 RepID=UPI00247540DA|nr:PP2C family protein-serine/threonine phosphatase [Streptomyces sp. MJP52]MDH6228855.1 serine phosphatase RsbU (regulator of sigma subunit) [Streptomyces sp. MJP52]
MPLLTRYGRAAWVLPMGCLIAIIVVGELGPSIRMVDWLLMVPLLASGVCSPTVTFLFAVLVVAINRWVDIAHPSVVIRPEDFLLQVTAALLALLIAVLRAQAYVYIRHLQNAAEITRQVILPPLPPSWGGIESAAHYQAADVEARVGGDFYDVLATPFGARVILGDVQGKGLPAVSTAGAVTGAFREAGYHEQDLDTVAQRLEHGLRRHNQLRQAYGEKTERFATAVVLAFPHDNPHTVDVVNFGHEGPLVIGPRGIRRLPQTQGGPIGMADLLGGTPAVRRAPLETNETILLVTDGVTEARNHAGEFFPLRHHLEQLATDHPHGIAPAHLVQSVLHALHRHTHGHTTDDIALLAVRHPAQPHQAPRT